MKALALLLLLPVAAHAESFFQIEAGIGASVIKDMGDGTWIQEGSPNNRERKTTPALMAGFTGELYRHGDFDVRYHLDYAYMGEFSASVDGVPDSQYDSVHHVIVGYQGERYSPFSGHGHLQGVPATLDFGYTYKGWRFGIEGGAWTYWQTWHESLYALDNQWHDLSHKTHAQVSYVVGASVSHRNLSLSFRHYDVRQSWNPYPGLATGANVLMATYRF